MAMHSGSNGRLTLKIDGEEVEIPVDSLSIKTEQRDMFTTEKGAVLQGQRHFSVEANVSKLFQGVTLGNPQTAGAMRMNYNADNHLLRQPTVSDKAGQVTPENIAALAAAAAAHEFKSKQITQDTFLQLMREAVQARNSPDAVGAWGTIFRGKNATRDELAATCMQALLIAAVKDAGPDVLASAIDSLVFSGAGKRISELSYFMADQMIAARDPATEVTTKDSGSGVAPLYFGATASGNAPVKAGKPIHIKPVSEWSVVMGPKGVAIKKEP